MNPIYDSKDYDLKENCCNILSYQPSDEQQTIIDHIKNGKNVIVNAVAGSGKSTTIISLAQQLTELPILQITYNSMLRHEMKEKIQNFALLNLTIHTFHSLAVKYYLDSAHTDTELRHILYRDIPMRADTPAPTVAILAIDEAQDMSLLYFHFIVKFIRDLGENPPQRLLVLGDHQQSLYEFKGADTRFLTKAHEIWAPIFKNHFEICELKTSYRITIPMASFVNQTMLGHDRMVANREGEPVVYIRNSRYNIEKTVVYQIKQLLETCAKPSDIFILAGSVKGLNSHVRKLENILVENNIPCHIPVLENDKLDERVIQGKIVFSTFHTVKGRQRRYVFVVGFDHSYFQTIGFNLDPKICPNTLYVGCTRATDGLFLLEFDNYSTDRPLEFLKMSHHEMNACEFIKFKGLPQIRFSKPVEKPDAADKKNTRYLTPTKLIKFIPEHVMDEIVPIIERIFHREDTGSQEPIDIPNIIQTAYGYEDVSDLNGIAIPAMYYDEICPNCSGQSLYMMIEGTIAEMRENEHPYLKKIVKNLPKTCETIDDYLYLANIYTSIRERLYFKLKQIKREEYNWLSPAIIEQCRGLLQRVIGIESGMAVQTEPDCGALKTRTQQSMCGTTQSVQTEKTIIHHSYDEENDKIARFLAPYLVDTPLESIKFKFTAIVDLLTPQTIWNGDESCSANRRVKPACLWEIKCTTKITIEHQLQLILYAWIWRIIGEGQQREQSKILNIKTGEIWRLDATLEELTTVVIALLKGKYMKPKDKTDDEFMADILFR